MQAKNNLFLGALFFIALLILGFFTILVKDVTLLQGRAGMMKIVFDRVDGLDVGHKVLASGMEVGQVSALRLRDDGKVEVDVNLTQPLKLYEGYQIRVKDTSALGGKEIDIVTNAQVAHEEKLKPLVAFDGETVAAQTALAKYEEEQLEIKGSATPSLLDNPDVRELINSLKRVANNIEQGEGTIGLLIKEREVYDNLRASSENLRTITERLREAEGTLGKLLYDRKLSQRIERIVANVEDVTTRIRHGKGTLGRFLSDDQIYEDFKATITDARRVAANAKDLTERVKKGEGTVGKLFTDDQVYQELQETLVEARTMMKGLNKAVRRINEGKGTIGALMSNDKMARDLEETLESVKVVAARLKKGEGTLGRIMADDELYQEIRRLLKNFSDSLEDTREQVPITTFTNILFRAF